MARPADRISLAEIIRHIDGPLAPVRCVSERFYERCTCPDEGRCGIRSVMREVRDAVAEMLERVTLAELVRRTLALAVPRGIPDGPDYMI